MAPEADRQQHRRKLQVSLTGLFVSSVFLAGSLLYAALGGGPEAASASAGTGASAKAFLKASSVLLHPRCMNCHPAGDQPLVGDLSEPHPMQVNRGSDGMGGNGLSCKTCHKDRNTEGLHMPPGSPGWQLPSGKMRMVFERKTPRQLCEQLKDPAQNGGRNSKEVLEFLRTAPLVAWAWNPGGSRTPPPLSHQEFIKNVTEWIEKGAACPQ